MLLCSRVRGFACCLAALCLLPAASALGEVRSGFKQFPAPQAPPALTPQPTPTQQKPYLSSFALQYDASVGAVNVDVSFFDANLWQRDVSMSFEVAAGCTQEPAELSGRISYARYDSADDEVYQGSTISRDGYAGELAGIASVTQTGFHVIYQAPGLAGLDLRCVRISAPNVVYSPSSGEPLKPQFEFAGYETKQLTTDNATASFGGLLEQRFGAAWTNADPKWLLCPRQQFTDAEDVYSDGGEEPAVSRAICQAQFRTGSTWRRVSASIEQGEQGPQWSSRPFIYAFVRRWRQNRPACLRGTARGTAWSNDGDCYALQIGDLTYSLRQGKLPRHVYAHGTNTAGFDRAVKYRCKRKGRTIECLNKLGDGFRFKPAR